MEDCVLSETIFAVFGDSVDFHVFVDGVLGKRILVIVPGLPFSSLFVHLGILEIRVRVENDMVLLLLRHTGAGWRNLTRLADALNAENTLLGLRLLYDGIALGMVFLLFCLRVELWTM